MIIEAHKVQTPRICITDQRHVHSADRRRLNEKMNPPTKFKNDARSNQPKKDRKQGFQKKQKREEEEIKERIRKSLWGHESVIRVPLALERGGSRDDLNELGGDAGLAGAVVLQRQAVQHLRGVLR